MHRSMFLAFLVITGSLLAQEKCDFGSPEAADALVKALQSQKTCKAAAQLMDECRWGSSADAEFSSLVVEKCEGEFFNKLSPAGTENYETAMQLCAYEYARQEGTISISEAAMCQVGVADRFAADPASNDRAPSNASFDCAKAQTELEKAICSDIRLGHADIVLADVYRNAQKWAGPEKRAKLAQSERSWLKALPTKCIVTSVPLTEKQISCLRNQIEIRFSVMDGCGEAEDSGRCLLIIDNPENVEDIKPVQEMSRASFDCEAPKTALEIVICADSELGQKDIELAQAYREADASMGQSQHAKLVESERNWLRFVASSCPLGTVGGIPPVLTRACVRSAFEARIAQLRLCSQKPASDQMPCVGDFQITAK